MSTRANLAFMGAWIVFFAAMTLDGRTDGRHTGDRLPFWQEACAQDDRGACDRLLQLETTYCGDNSAWACNELGAHHRVGRIVAADDALADAWFTRACALRLKAGCLNLLDADAVTRTDPRPLDLRLLLREGGANLMEASEPELRARACDHGWSFACDEGVGP
jgi:hypothetical protein